MIHTHTINGGAAMNLKAFSLAVIFALVVLISTVASSSAEDIKTRMAERLPVIKELKAKGIIGENNRGYLEFTGTNREKNDVVTAENNDRGAAYSDIAKSQGATVDFVGMRRAKQITERAGKGEWLQDEQGKWYKK
jgi:uncharacterized protein YdbL (DUF1318 family)